MGCDAAPVLCVDMPQQSSDVPGVAPQPPGLQVVRQEAQQLVHLERNLAAQLTRLLGALASVSESAPISPPEPPPMLPEASRICSGTDDDLPLAGSKPKSSKETLTSDSSAEGLCLRGRQARARRRVRAATASACIGRQADGEADSEMYGSIPWHSEQQKASTSSSAKSVGTLDTEVAVAEDTVRQETQSSAATWPRQSSASSKLRQSSTHSLAVPLGGSRFAGANFSPCFFRPSSIARPGNLRDERRSKDAAASEEHNSVTLPLASRLNKVVINGAAPAQAPPAGNVDRSADTAGTADHDSPDESFGGICPPTSINGTGAGARSQVQKSQSSSLHAVVPDIPGAVGENMGSQCPHKTLNLKPWPSGAPSECETVEHKSGNSNVAVLSEPTGPLSFPVGCSSLQRSDSPKSSQAEAVVAPKREFSFTGTTRKSAMCASCSEPGMATVPDLKRKSGQSMLAKENGGSSWKVSRPSRTLHERRLFPCTDELKDNLRRALLEQEYSVHNFYHKTGWAQHIAKSELFETCTLVVIAANAIWISVDIDLNDKAVLFQADLIFQIAEISFCTFFFFEWFVRFLAFEMKRHCIRDAWFVFDTMLMVAMVLETWVVSILFYLGWVEDPGVFTNGGLFRMVRILRVARISRMAKILHALPEIMVFVKGISIGLRAVACTLILLGCLIYVFSIAFTDMLKGTAVGQKLFSSVPRAMSTLLLSSTAPDLIDMLEKDIAGEHILYAVLFFLFICLGSITVMNMMIGVLVEMVSVVSTVERDSLDMQFVKHYLLDLYQPSDDGEKDMVSKEQFSELLQKPEAAKALMGVGVDVVGLFDIIDYYFQDGKQMSFSEFLDLVLQLRGSNRATVKDIVDLRKFIIQELGTFDSSLQSCLRYVGELPRNSDAGCPPLVERSSEHHRHSTAKSSFKLEFAQHRQLSATSGHE